jgi:hypothetical protein
MTRRRRRHRKLRSCLVTASLVVAGSLPTIGTADAESNAEAPAFDCPAPESFPAAGSPRDANPVPYEVPFSGTLDGGVLRVGSLGVQAVIGPIDAKFCGHLTLPDESGEVANDEIDITDNPIPVNAGIMGLQIFGAYVQVKGHITAMIDPHAAASGGLNIDLSTTIDATLVPTVSALGQLGLQIPLSEAICSGEAGPIPLTTLKSGRLQGQPITGPLTGGSAVVVSNDFVFPAFTPTAPEVTTVPPPPKGDCVGAATSAVNLILGLPNPAGVATFVAPASFSIHLDQ